MAFAAFTKLTPNQYIFMNNSCNKFYSGWAEKCINKGKVSLTPPSRVGISLCKFVTAQWHYLEMYTLFHPNWSRTVGSTVKIHLHF
jgi:hypothetical protein